MVEESDRNSTGAGNPAPGTLEDAAQLRILEPNRLRVFRQGATLRLTIEGEASFLKIGVFRTFPLTMPQGYFSLCDGGGKEIGILLGMDGLSAESRLAIEGDLERRYMVAIIRRIRAVKERFGVVEWDVETHRGLCRFTTRDLRGSVLRCGPGHFLLTDVENNRYEIPDLNAMDVRSQAWLLRHL